MSGGAERTLGLILACRKELPLLLRAGAWDPEGKQRGRLLHGAHVLLVGTRDVDALTRVLLPTGAHVARPADPAAATPEETAGADVLVLLPGSAAVGADVLAALPDAASVVDVSGSAAVDVDALADGLATGRPLHAALVAESDTPPAGHPLWRSARVLVVPEEHAA